MIISDREPTLDEALEAGAYQSYSYSYPHKTAYRPLDPPIALARAWRDEPTDSLFLYLHIPFCEMRCGFCNLFTLAQPKQDLAMAYLEVVRRQARAAAAFLPDARFARLALGGGTPTFLSLDELQHLFATLHDVLGAEPNRLPASCEASPATIDREKLSFLRASGVDRLSLGVQSFDERDAGRMGRPQSRRQLDHALDLIRSAGFPTLNIDLIYGAEGQTMERWLRSVLEAVAQRAEEIYLYPLYVRPLTGLGRREHQWRDWRREAYREGRALLLAAGYEQQSLRMFRAAHAPEETGPVYCCQQDGMLGLGCGARSYTRTLHYADRYGVERGAIRGILDEYLQRSEQDFMFARYGYQLDPLDQSRRFAIQSLLQAAGLERAGYRRRFERDVLADIGQLRQLEQRGLARIDAERIQLTELGLEQSDAIGPWLYSPRVRSRMEEYAWSET